MLLIKKLVQVATWLLIISPRYRLSMKNIIIIPFIVLSLMLFQPAHAGAAITPAAPALNASSYLVMDFDSGQLLAEHNADQKLPPASLTKIMTVYVAASELGAGNISLDDKVMVSEKAWRMTGSRMFIEVNKQVSVRELLDGIIIQSGNDASVALAEYISGDESVFAQLMNQHAVRLGMKNSHFMDASGLPHAEHYSTAHDLALLSAALIRDYPGIYKIHSQKEFTFNGIRQQNRNRMLWQDSTVDGVKTGHTEEAGYCLVASARRDDMRLISVVMGTDGDKSRTSATQALLNYGFRFFETRKVHGAGAVLTSVKIWKGLADKVDLGLNQDLYLTIARGQFANLKPDYELPDRIIAPVVAGQETGRLKLKLADQEIANLPLTVLQAVPEAGVFKRMKDSVRLLME